MNNTPPQQSSNLMYKFIFRDLRGSGRSLWVLCVCLLLGVTLIAASGGLLRQVRDGLLADTRALFGGDVEISQHAPLQPEELNWLQRHGEVSLVIELRTMLRTSDNRSQVVELQSFDEHYPLYGEVSLQPPQPLAEVLSLRDGVWGAAFDPVLGNRLGLNVGDRVSIGQLSVELRARIERQPDRSLSADWRGPPLILSAQALAATGLVQPGSLLDYEYRIKTEQDLDPWRAALNAAFPEANWEVRTFTERSQRLGTVLDQLGSVLLLIGFSALFIGGLGVSNSVHAYLQSKLNTLAILRALGLRENRLARLYLAQILILAGGASLLGAVLGGGLALAGAALVAGRLPLAPAVLPLLWPSIMATLFGLLTALTFTLPALGRAMTVTPAALFRGTDTASDTIPARYRYLTLVAGLLTVAAVLIALPQPGFGLGFFAVTLGLLVLLEGLIRLLRYGAKRLGSSPLVRGQFQWRLALANLYRPGNPLRPLLLSLGSALTLLVAMTLIVAALLKTIHETLPDRAPTLVFYDIANFQLDDFRTQVEATPSLNRLDLAPLVLGRLSRVNDELLRESADLERALEARDEHKLSYRLNNFDQIKIDRGEWWPADYTGPPLVAMEDREADQLGLKVGDELTFSILGKEVNARLAAIYSQRRFESRFWLEAVFSDGVLDPFISRYVGAAYLDHSDAIDLQSGLARKFPNVVAVRTQTVLEEANALLSKAATALAVVAAISLAASLLVLISVVASNRARQIHEATVLYTLGARFSAIRSALWLEQILIMILTSLFALGLGGLIAHGLLEWRLDLQSDGIWWTAVILAPLVSGLSLGLGARYLLRQFRLAPATLLRSSG